MADYGMPEADSAALDRVWTEERFRRAKALADDLFEAATHPLTDPRIRAKTEELASLLYELGLHLDATADYDITGPDA